MVHSENICISPSVGSRKHTSIPRAALLSSWSLTHRSSITSGECGDDCTETFKPVGETESFECLHTKDTDSDIYADELGRRHEIPGIDHDMGPAQVSPRSR